MTSKSRFKATMVAVFRLVTFVQGLSKRKARGKAVTKGKLDEEDNIYSPRNLSSVPRTSQNALRFALETLNSACQNLPIGSIITAAINPLLIITDRIEFRATNKVSPN
ncbi:hypothetical protein DFH07DRAFT_27783 [Mycena maculata]|uniref:Uncharacterized protein n=1 Tax=Mycena maculata TaxID=230809 RepID=A0AAD7N3L9_9AGAR|nr:hypothetical protein DFH07DRAFT_27783 [Mycena maculata]